MVWVHHSFVSSPRSLLLEASLVQNIHMAPDLNSSSESYRDPVYEYKTLMHKIIIIIMRMKEIIVIIIIRHTCRLSGRGSREGSGGFQRILNRIESSTPSTLPPSDSWTKSTLNNSNSHRKEEEEEITVLLRWKLHPLKEHRIPPLLIRLI